MPKTLANISIKERFATFDIVSFSFEIDFLFFTNKSFSFLLVDALHKSHMQ